MPAILAQALASSCMVNLTEKLIWLRRICQTPLLCFLAKSFLVWLVGLLLNHYNALEKRARTGNREVRLSLFHLRTAVKTLWKGTRYLRYFDCIGTTKVPGQACDSSLSREYFPGLKASEIFLLSVFNFLKKDYLSSVEHFYNCILRVFLLWIYVISFTEIL